MPGACSSNSVVYQATVKSDQGGEESYVGVDKNFKNWYGKRKTIVMIPHLTAGKRFSQTVGKGSQSNWQAPRLKVKVKVNIYIYLNLLICIFVFLYHFMPV